VIIIEEKEQLKDPIDLKLNVLDLKGKDISLDLDSEFML